MLTQTIIRKTLRVPRSTAASGNGSALARQMDAVLTRVGFKASQELLEHLSGLKPRAAKSLALNVIEAVRGLVGDHVSHNSYFVDFPDGVPDTVEFWVSCLREALITSGTGAPSRRSDALAFLSEGWVRLLDLPSYGRYRHTHAELLAAHDELIPSVKDRLTVLHLGGTLDAEKHALFTELASSVTPLGEADLDLFATLAADCAGGVLPENIPVRENRAVVNAVRLAARLPLVAVDTVVDVLRVACQASGGDPTLVEPTRFRSFTRAERRSLLAAMERVVADNWGKLSDVAHYAERFKRLGERLHPGEHQQFPHAQDVFAVARGERRVRSLAGRAEAAFAEGDVLGAATVLATAPGHLMRSLDRLLRCANEPGDLDRVFEVVAGALGAVSGRVLCSVREHLGNRTAPETARVFITRSRRAWTTPDRRAPLPDGVIERACAMIDAELASRLPEYEHLVVDPAVLDVALPLSGKASEDGFAVMPRGSRTRVDGQVLRFFTYWRQNGQATDFDLSALLLDEEFRYVGHVSWTRLRSNGAVYSGDITSAPGGATEFIDIPLDTVDAAYVVPQVDIYSGEGFDEVAESMFGWMTRDRSQKGAPFDARTVRTRSEMRGTGRVALPILFGRNDDDGWTATWLHLYLSGSPRFNQVEGHQVNTSALTRAVARRDHLTVRYLVELLRRKAGRVTTWTWDSHWDGPVTFLGVHEPEGLPAGSTVITLDRLTRLIPR
ncbi:TerD family protein [Allokutzneria sp. NRRL B-24872]|uniref:TerD family protein n=1 Tax=Allokutzneria sp. NRRL B-24872 TaxID=1137961 RepID=UPI000A3CDAA6|nr:TerD family protein [Allokutzneria sp. NRRL B-24872]